MTRPAPQPYSRRPTEVWAAARADFEAGASMRVVAERHQLNIRTVSRHARTDGWEAPRLTAAEAYDMALAERTYDPSAFQEAIGVD
ncbi:MAG TPA: hypothetical protein VM348_00995, partial [Brevundimonas sp.]|nr:hypothetical protein [Brevundimonas sp.]